MDTSLTAALAIGFVLGLRHALDADHIAAVSALVSRHRSLTRSCVLGTFWGAGHTTALLAAAVSVITFKITISPAVEHGLESAVALLLILLGGDVFLRSLESWATHRHERSHEGNRGSHLHLRGDGTPTHARGQDSHARLHLIRLARRPFLVGLLHGLAGSAALMLLVLAAIPSPGGGLLYVLVFGVGSTAGMLLVSGVISIPFIVTAGRSQSALLGIQLLAGATSLLLGSSLLWRLDVGG
jgi:high-affinity nickel permease